MGANTGIEWTDATWNPIRGCSRVSEGCRNCYAEGIAARFSGVGEPYHGLAGFKVIEHEGRPKREARWTGDIRFVREHLGDPLKWHRGRRVFVNSMSDLFHPGVTPEMLGEVFAVMARAPQHTYQILTKRPERMWDALRVGSDLELATSFEKIYSQHWPPPNWHFGVSIEDQVTARFRLPILARCNSAVRIISYEPAIGPIDFAEVFDGDESQMAAFDWIIMGGESGHGARPMNPEWARATRDFCQRAGIPFFFKQWGEFTPNVLGINDSYPPTRVGKKAAGRNLDGREWRQFPEQNAVELATEAL